MFGQKKLLVRVSEAARLLSVSQASIKRLIAAGTLPTVRVERLERIPFAALETFAAGENGGGTSHPANTQDVSTTVPDPAVPTSPQAAPPVKVTVVRHARDNGQRKDSPLGKGPLMPEVTEGDNLKVACRRKTAPVPSQPSALDTPVAPSLYIAPTPEPPVAQDGDNNEHTVAHLIAEWLRDAEGRLRPRTYASYAQMARLHIMPEFGALPIAAVDIRMVEEFLRRKHQSGLSPRTVLYLRGLLRQSFQDALRWDWISRNIIPLTRGPKQERTLSDTLSLEESRRLVASFCLPCHGSLFTTTLGLGLRFGEILGLRWKDVTLSEDGKSGKVSVQVQLQRVNKVLTLVPPKSRSGVRTLAAPAFVARALRQRQRVESKERIAAGSTWEGDDWGLVFSNQWGRPLDESHIRQCFREHLTQHGFSPMRFHDLRHQCASLLIAQGTSPRAVMEILGHSQISLTMDTYSHIMPSVHQATAAALDDLLYPK